MGHKVSTPRHHDASLHGNSNAAMATSLVILLAVAASTSNTVSASSSASRCGCCFVQQPQQYSWPPSAHASSSSSSSSPTFTSTSLRATNTLVTTVPPPNSRLGRLRQQATQSLSSTLHHQPPGTKRRGKNKRTDLRYSSYGSHYSQYCENGGDDSTSIDGFTPSWNTLFSSTNKANDAIEYGEDQECTTSLSIASTNNTASASINNIAMQGNHTQDMNKANYNINNKQALRKLFPGKRARMVRFLDRRFSRLQLKSNKQKSNNKVYSSMPGNNSSKSPNNKSSFNNRLMYEERKAAWAAKYTSVSTLRKSFGTNKNKFWGDYDPTSTRKLYHTLLPKALLELRSLRDGLLKSKEETEEETDGVDTKMKRRARTSTSKAVEAAASSASDTDDYLQQELKELAPLAYQARLAAKKYARERSRLPGRIGSMLYDGYRSWRRYGKFNSGGMTWEQVWNKYEDQVLREAMEELEEAAAMGGGGTSSDLISSSMGSLGSQREDLDDEELTARICMRILERSVVTNGAIDKLFLERLADKDDEEDTSNNENVDYLVAEESRKRRRRRQQRQRARKLRIQADLAMIEQKFDDDIRELLQLSNLTTREAEERRGKRKSGKFFWKKSLSGDDGALPSLDENGISSASLDAQTKGVDSKDVEMAAAFARGGGENTATSATPPDSDQLAAAMFSISGASANKVDEEGQAASAKSTEKSSLQKLAVHEVFALRILATTKQRITSLQSLPQLGGTKESGSGLDADTSEEEDEH